MLAFSLVTGRPQCRQRKLSLDSTLALSQRGAYLRPNAATSRGDSLGGGASTGGIHSKARLRAALSLSACFRSLCPFFVVIFTNPLNPTALLVEGGQLAQSPLTPGRQGYSQ